MGRRIGWVSLALLGAVVLPPLPARAADGDDVKALAGRIDHWVEARWAAARVKPVARADDAEFIRRAYLDLAGRIPSILEVRDFLDDDRPDKRRIWVDKLLEADTYPRHFANVWRATLLPELTEEQAANLADPFENWLRERLKANTGYDAMVREIVTGPPGGDVGAASFYQANEMKAENLAGSVARRFLGVNLDCAQCHAHPFARWSRNQFWEFAAFFVDVDAAKQRAGQAQAEVPGTGKKVRARYLNGKEYRPQNGATPRAALAAWITAADNPYFARASVNRVWAYLFGIGLIEPVDDASDQNPPSHPELLDELARSFVAHKYDLKFLIRAITSSRAYQLSSSVPDGKPIDLRLFARMPLRGLSPEQVFDSVAEAVEYHDPGPVGRRAFGGGEDPSPRGAFLSKFRNHDKRTESHTTILQALFLMNNKFMADATSLEGNKTLATIAEASSTSTARRVETLFLVVLSRKPRPDEEARLIKYVDRGGPSGDRKKALADIFWALLNSAEFSVNH